MGAANVDAQSVARGMPVHASRLRAAAARRPCGDRSCPRAFWVRAKSDRGRTRAKHASVRAERPGTMRMDRWRTAVTGTITALAALGSSISASAQSVADFYRGKTPSRVIATSPGGDYDLRARLIAVT